MAYEIVVKKGRTNVVLVSVPYNISEESFSSEIRSAPSPTSPLIATWEVTFENDGNDGKLRLCLDDTVTGLITESQGYMDIKRVSNGEPLPLFNGFILVTFEKVVTA